MISGFSKSNTDPDNERRYITNDDISGAAVIIQGYVASAVLELPLSGTRVLKRSLT